MSEENFEILDIARRQLETAIHILCRGKDPFSAITLAGSARGLLAELVLSTGLETFTDRSRRIAGALYGETPSRPKHEKHIKQLLATNETKHHSESTSDILVVDAIATATDAITAAIADFQKVDRNNNPFIKRFFEYTWLHRDGQKVFESYQAGKVYEKPRAPQSHTKRAIAIGQLHTAFMLIATGGDDFSVISLASAADNILSGLLLNDSKEDFIARIIESEFQKTGERKTRGEISKEINEALHVNRIKHFDRGRPEQIRLDSRGCAMAAVSKAFANYIFLEGRDNTLAMAFAAWVRTQNLPEAVLAADE